MVTPVCRYLLQLMKDQTYLLGPIIHGSCHGLLLSYASNRTCSSIFCHYFICNPATHEKITLPSLQYVNVCGLFFHVLTREHRVLHYCSTGSNYCSYKIYSLEKNSWRELSCLCYAIPSSKNPVIVNGSLHWFAGETIDNKASGIVGNLRGNFILRFDMNFEVSDTIPHPEHESCSGKHMHGYEMREYIYRYKMQLLEVDGELCLCDLQDEEPVVINLWIFTDSTNKQCC